MEVELKADLFRKAELQKYLDSKHLVIQKVSWLTPMYWNSIWMVEVYDKYWHKTKTYIWNANGHNEDEDIHLILQGGAKFYQ